MLIRLQFYSQSRQCPGVAKVPNNPNHETYPLPVHTSTIFDTPLQILTTATMFFIPDASFETNDV